MRKSSRWMQINITLIFDGFARHFSYDENDTIQSISRDIEFF